MTQSEKLQKVIEKTFSKRKNEWIFPHRFYDLRVLTDVFYINLEKLIFDHDFCKAYFGEYDEVTGGVCNNRHGKRGGEEYCWVYHIQQLALTPPSERIDYLYSFIESDGK